MNLDLPKWLAFCWSCREYGRAERRRDVARHWKKGHLSKLPKHKVRVYRVTAFVHVR